MISQTLQLYLRLSPGIH